MYAPRDDAQLTLALFIALGDADDDPVTSDVSIVPRAGRQSTATTPDRALLHNSLGRNDMQGLCAPSRL